MPGLWTPYTINLINYGPPWKRVDHTVTLLTSVTSVTSPLGLFGITKIGPPVVLRTITRDFIFRVNTYRSIDFKYPPLFTSPPPLLVKVEFGKLTFSVFSILPDKNKKNRNSFLSFLDKKWYNNRGFFMKIRKNDMRAQNIWEWVFFDKIWTWESVFLENWRFF